jgi:NTP pyrophosphatase (non-canonical NTP hydrolase)
MTYCIYHIPGKKIGVTNDITNRLVNEQGYSEDDIEILEMSDSFDYVSTREIELQKQFGYRVETLLYKDLNTNNITQLKKMDINVTDQTTTFPCPVNKLKGRLMDEMGMSWVTNEGKCTISMDSIRYIMAHVQTSQYTKERCFIYNKALVKHISVAPPPKVLDKNTGTGRKSRDKDYYSKRSSPARVASCDTDGLFAAQVSNMRMFDAIRAWAKERGLYDKGDTKTQYLKLMEEAGELGRAILKSDQPEIEDAIGDMVVVLTNLAHLAGTSIEECTNGAYSVISKRTGKMVNGTFVKDK